MNLLCASESENTGRKYSIIKSFWQCTSECREQENYKNSGGDPICWARFLAIPSSWLDQRLFTLIIISNCTAEWYFRPFIFSHERPQMEPLELYPKLFSHSVSNSQRCWKKSMNSEQCPRPQHWLHFKFKLDKKHFCFQNEKDFYTHFQVSFKT